MTCYGCGAIFTTQNPVRVDSFGKVVCGSCKTKISVAIKQMQGV